jgi:hypothetical protein
VALGWPGNGKRWDEPVILMYFFKCSTQTNGAKMLVSTIWTHFSIEDGVVTSKKKAKVAFDRQNMHKKRCLSQQILDGFKQSGASRNCNSLASVARH